MAARKRRFGRIRKLTSGRYQVRYPGPDGIDHPAPYTFATKKEADRWLALKEAEINRDGWWDPNAGDVPFSEYAAEWVDNRELTPKSRRTYEDLLRLHLNPTFGNMRLKDIQEADIRKWRAAKLRKPKGRAQAPKAYRLMHAVLNTAVRDKLLRENPCQIGGAGQEDSEERPVLSVPEVFKLADAIKPRYRALVLLATFGSLRWGELAGLRRRHLDLDKRTVTVRETVYDISTLEKGKPKSKAGARTVRLPALIVEDLRNHLDTFSASGPNGFVFVGVKGNQLRRSNFSKYWADACTAVGLEDVHLHDLRHTGNTFAAEAGASLRELMNRMGHSSARAAMIYLHARDERAQELADRLGERAAEELRKARESGGDDDDEDPPLAGARV